MTQTLEEAPDRRAGARACCTSPPAPAARRCTSHGPAGPSSRRGRRLARRAHLGRRRPRPTATTSSVRGNREIVRLVLTAPRAAHRPRDAAARRRRPLRRAASSTCSACSSTSSPSPSRTRATTARSSSRRSATRSPASTTAATSSRRWRRRSQRSERYGSDASLALFDVDDFKRINDTYGHAAGDEVLREIGRIVDGLIRPTDSFARIGGEEFALLLPETSQLDALLVAERLRTRDLPPPDPPGPARHGQRRRRLLPAGREPARGARAARRRALYWAKRNGKDMCAVASEVVVDEADGDARRACVAHLYALVATIDDSTCTRATTPRTSPPTRSRSASALGLDRERIVRLRRAALLHDIGKVAVGAGILNKPAALTEAEYDEIKLHPVSAARCSPHAGLTEEAGWVRHHHERVDGTGYPDRLAGDEIPLEARIIFVADSFEAMTSTGPTARGMPVGGGRGRAAPVRRHASSSRRSSRPSRTLSSRASSPCWPCAHPQPERYSPKRSQRRPLLRPAAPDVVEADAHRAAWRAPRRRRPRPRRGRGVGQAADRVHRRAGAPGRRRTRRCWRACTRPRRRRRGGGRWSRPSAGRRRRGARPRVGEARPRSRQVVERSSGTIAPSGWSGPTAARRLRESSSRAALRRAIGWTTVTRCRARSRRSARRPASRTRWPPATGEVGVAGRAARAGTRPRLDPRGVGGVEEPLVGPGMDDQLRARAPIVGRLQVQGPHAAGGEAGHDRLGARQFAPRVDVDPGAGPTVGGHRAPGGGRRGDRRELSGEAQGD